MCFLGSSPIESCTKPLERVLPLILESRDLENSEFVLPQLFFGYMKKRSWCRYQFQTRTYAAFFLHVAFSYVYGAVHTIIFEPDNVAVLKGAISGWVERLWAPRGFLALSGIRISPEWSSKAVIICLWGLIQHDAPEKATYNIVQ